MREKMKVIELKEQVDNEILKTKNLKLEARLLKMKILRIQKETPGILQRLSPKAQKHNRWNTVSLTPHPRKARYNFS